MKGTLSADVSHLLLDIEGTTCPVSFVAETLFPYAIRAMGEFLADPGNHSKVEGPLMEVSQAWREDPHQEAQDLAKINGPSETEGHPLLPYLQWLMREDSKLTALKELQGMVWEAGYTSGALQGPLFNDVPEALHRWHGMGKVLAVYSSGSVAAQKLIYTYSNAGNLSDLFSYWFDTRVGKKQEQESYAAISCAMNVKPGKIVFISDSISELEAADAAGLHVLFSAREGNPAQDAGRFCSINSLAGL